MPWCVLNTKGGINPTTHIKYPGIFQDSIYFAMVMKCTFILLFLSLCTHLPAQQMGGLWKGTLTQEPGGCFPTYNLELQIKVVEKKVTGVCYHYSDTKNYVKKHFEGEYNSFTKSISIKETDLIALQIPVDCTPCVKTYDLWYSNNRKETLSGDWIGFVLDTKEACQPGHIVLSRIQESAFAGIQEIMVDTGDIRLEFYDNGEIDNDSISVVVNNKEVLSNEKLGARPVTLFIRMENTRQMQEVVMKAENLGSIPPNTALLIVTTGKKRYKLYLTSTDKRNAAVRFIYDPAEGLNRN